MKDKSTLNGILHFIDPDLNFINLVKNCENKEGEGEGEGDTLQEINMEEVISVDLKEENEPEKNDDFGELFKTGKLLGFLHEHLHPSL